MAINYPSSLDSLTNPAGTSLMNSPDHATQHSNINDIGVALETKVGVGSGTPVANKALVGSGNGTSGWTDTWNSASFGTPTITAPVIRSYSGWQDANETWTFNGYDSAGLTGTVTIAADVTAKYSKGMKLKFTQGGTQMYSFVTKDPTVASGTTTMMFFMGTAYNFGTTAISSNYFSTENAPQGFPLTPTFWTAGTVDTSNRTQASPTQNTWYNLGTVKLDVPIGDWRLTYGVFPDVETSSTVATSLIVQTTLSTTGTTETDKDFSTYNFHISSAVGAVSQFGVTLYREKYVNLASKTTYFLNTLAGNGTPSSINNFGGISSTFIRAICAYL